MLTTNPLTDVPTHLVTEPDICAELDARLELAGVFVTYKEVCGTYLQPRLGAEVKPPRIDRILVPNKRLIDAGWRHGIIGVECKAPGKKLGPAITQCMDYSRASFRLPKNSFDIMPRWIVLWPMAPEDLVGDLASVMDNHASVRQ